MQFVDVNQDAIICGALDKSNVYNVPVYSGDKEDYIDLEITFNSDNYELVHEVPVKRDVLNCLHHSMLMFGVNPFAPLARRAYVWPALQQAFYASLRTNDYPHETGYSLFAMLENMLRRMPQHFDCPVHQWPVNYDSNCELCCASVLSECMRKEWGYFDDETSHPDSSIEWNLSSRAMLTSFIHYVYTLSPAPFVMCSHDECVRKYDPSIQVKDFNIIGKEMGFYSTRNCGVMSSYAIIGYLHDIGCHLHNSIKTAYQLNNDKRELRAFDFGLATRVVTFLIKSLNYKYLVELKTITPGAENRKPYQRLVLRMPLESIDAHIVENVYKLFPTVMINYGILGFDLHKCTDHFVDYPNLEMPREFKVKGAYDFFEHKTVDSPILLVRDMLQQEASPVVEIAHQIITSNGPLISDITANYINVALRGFQMGLISTFKFNNVYFPARTDSRMKIVLASKNDLNHDYILRNIQNLISDVHFINIIKTATQKSLHDEFLNHAVSYQFTVTYKTFGRVHTVIVPLIDLEIITGGIERIGPKDFNPEDVSCVLSAISTTMMWSMLPYKNWLKLQNSCSVMRNLYPKSRFA